MSPSLRVVSFPRVVLLGILLAMFVPQARTWSEVSFLRLSAYLLIFSFLLSYLMMPIVIAAGIRFGLVDKPDEERKHHQAATPVTGGIAIFLAFVTTILYNFHFSVETKAVLVASTGILLLGILDDRFRLSARLRLIVQVAAALVLVMYGVRVTFVPDFLGGVFTETVITLVWIIGITNSMNFIDGMDGLASGTSIIYSGFFALVALVSGQPYMMFLAIAIAGSCLGFFPYNFRKGKAAAVFLGDAGSTFLGFLLASFAILGEWGDSIIDLAVPVLIMSVLIFDMTLTTVVRIASGEVRSVGEWIHYTGRDHFHHRLAHLGISPKQAAGLFFSVSFCFGLEALVVLFSDVKTSGIVLVHSVLVFIIIGIILVVKKSDRQKYMSLAADESKKG